MSTQLFRISKNWKVKENVRVNFAIILHNSRNFSVLKIKNVLTTFTLIARTTCALTSASDVIMSTTVGSKTTRIKTSVKWVYRKFSNPTSTAQASLSLLLDWRINPRARYHNFCSIRCYSDCLGDSIYGKLHKENYEGSQDYSGEYSRQQTTTRVLN